MTCTSKATQLRGNLIRLQSYCIELGKLQSASDAIGYSVFINKQGETLQNRIDLLQSKIDDLRESILSEVIK